MGWQHDQAKQRKRRRGSGGDCGDLGGRAHSSVKEQWLLSSRQMPHEMVTSSSVFKETTNPDFLKKLKILANS